MSETLSNILFILILKYKIFVLFYIGYIGKLKANIEK